jgi:hypothetical protein
MSESQPHLFWMFTYAQATERFTPDEVRARVASGRWVRVFDGVYRSRDSPPTPRSLVAAAGLAIGRPVPACLHTAAAIWGFDVLDDAETHIAVGPRLGCLRRPGLWPHQLDLRPADVVRARCGTRLTAPDRTAVDLARFVPVRDALAVLDAAVASGRCTVDSLRHEVARHRGQRGVRLVRALIPLADPHVDSPQESRLRQLCHMVGLPAPVRQLHVVDADGRWHDLDLGWASEQVGAEYDGEVHDLPASRRKDRRRYNWFTDLGWRLFHATDADIYGDPRPFLVRLARALDATLPNRVLATPGGAWTLP